VCGWWRRSWRASTDGLRQSSRILGGAELSGNPLSWATPGIVSLSGYADYAQDDPEPEFVDINKRNEAVVTLQENNHIVIVDLESLSVKKDFPLGSVNLQGVDAKADGVIALTDTLLNVPREPDAVAWVPGASGALNVATANEGDLFGGSRGFSIFRQNGALVFDSGNALEELAVQYGHYPEDRSDAKGTEPEAIAYAKYGDDDYLFVGSERGSFVAVYKLDRAGRPRFEQLLPAPLGPEGLLTIPERNLLVVSGETDLEGFNVRSTVMIYQLRRGEPSYPQILSEVDKGSPIPWSALSGLVSIPGRADSLLGVWDSAYGKSNIFKIDVSEKPAVVADVMTITGGRGNYDPEGIAIAPDHTLWIASEGNASDSRPNLLVKTTPDGNVIEEIGLPAEVIASRQATTGTVPRATLGSGFEGLAILRDIRNPRRYRLVVAQQRGWNFNATPSTLPVGRCEAIDDDGGGLNANGEPNWSRIWIYDPMARSWSSVAWELAPKPANAAWVGLSEITEVPGTGDFILIERDNRGGDFAVLKTLVKLAWHDTADGIVTSSDKGVYDLLPKLKSTNGWITDKPEGVAVNWLGETYVVTDNDGVSDWSGESWFFDLGRYWRLF
jgi:hypothetical protein